MSRNLLWLTLDEGLVLGLGFFHVLFHFSFLGLDILKILAAGSITYAECILIILLFILEFGEVFGVFDSHNRPKGGYKGYTSQDRKPHSRFEYLHMIE